MKFRMQARSDQTGQEFDLEDLSLSFHEFFPKN
jgi:hypothetical protein